MWEHVAVSSSSSDPDALASALDERTRDGWEVLAITPGDQKIVAFLRRQTDGGATASNGTGSVAADAGTASTPTATGSGAAEPVAAAEGSLVSSDAGSSAGGSPSANADWGATVLPGAGGDPSPWAPRSSTEPTPTTSASSEPAGWASAPEPQPQPEPAPAPTPAPAPVAQPQTPANWYPDPSGRFELRYWSGTAWTEHVSRGGVQYTDPPTA